MFQFNFDVEDGVEEEAAVADTAGGSDATSTAPQTGEPFSEISLDSLLEALPTQISYSFLSADGRDLKLARRDLFDARFQLISQGSGDPESVDQAPKSEPSFDSALQFIDNPFDLVPLVYEGGLKTWECSLDLASCLKNGGHATNAKGARVLELGCGTAIPTLCILHELFSSPPADDTETHIHLQDYNASVLQLVTMPNVVLAWYTSSAAEAYRRSEPHDSADVDSELHITPQLLSAFRTSLRDCALSLRFFSGSWDTFDLSRTGGRYDLVLTSETIYHPPSLPTLVRLMRDACVAPPGDARCFVAGKTVYFGVGGGIAEFVRCVETIAGEGANGGTVETIWETSTGVSRRVMRVWWNMSDE